MLVEHKQKPTPWQRITGILRALYKDIMAFLGVAEFFAYIGLLAFTACAIGLTLRNEPIRLNIAGLVFVAFCGMVVLSSFLYGYWEHLLKRGEEWER